MKCPLNKFEECLKEECGFYYVDEGNDINCCSLIALVNELVNVREEIGITG